MKPILQIDKFGFDIVHGCQLRCVGCPNSTLKPKIKEVSPENFNACLANVDVSSVSYLRLFNFGEPLLHKRLPDILVQIPRQSWKAAVVEISTNAQYHDFPLLAEALKTGVLTRLVVSADGEGTAEEYERLRPPGKWDKLLEFLGKVRVLRDRYAPGLQLMTRNVCITEEGRARWSNLLSPMGWQPEFRGWLNLPGSIENMLGRAPKVPQRLCSFIAPNNRLYVDYDGTVVPCCVHPRAGVFGNLLTQRYSEILLGTARQKMSEAMSVDRTAMKICNACEF